MNKSNKSNQSPESKADQKTQPKQENSAQVEDQFGSNLSTSNYTKPAVYGVGLQGLVNLLNRQDVSVIQRQRLAAKIGSATGNRYLQRMIASAGQQSSRNSNPKAKVSQRLITNASVIQLTPEEEIRRECQQRYNRDDYEGIAARNERLLHIFQSIGAHDARQLYERLIAEGRARDDFARLFQGSLAEETRSRLLATLRTKFQEAAIAERQWHEDHPEPGITRSNNVLILWNFPIDSAEIQPAHQASIRPFLESQETAWMARGTYLEITGRASESGLEGHNLDLSRRRAQAIHALVNAILGRRDIRVTGLGASQPLASQESAEGMARNRSVEIAVIAPELRPVPNRDQKWRYAQEHLESRIGTTVFGGPDVMWTPTETGVMMMIPRLPLEELTLPDFYGANVPTDDLCSDRPASGCMPEPRYATRKILGEELEREFGRNLRSGLTNQQIREVVQRFIRGAEYALEQRTRRLSELQGKVVLGGGAAIERGWERYRRAEAAYFFSDPTCMWRHLQSQ